MHYIEFYIFRHGETDWNKERRFQGHTDIPLNEAGKQQANVLTDKLFSFKPEIILSSDLIRAVQTAEIANKKLNAPLHTSKELRECLLGEPEGMYLDDITLKYGPTETEKWHSVLPEYEHFGFPNGETKFKHKMRLINFLETYVKENNKYKKIGVSTHGGSIRRIVHHCNNAPEQAIQVQNCALFLIQYTPKDNTWNYIEQK